MLTLLLLCTVGCYALAKLSPTFVKLKVLGKTFNCAAQPKHQKEEIIKYTCTIPSNNPDLTSVSIENFWVAKNDIFNPKEFLADLLKEMLENGVEFSCHAPSTQIAVGSGITSGTQILMRVTPNSLIVLQNTNSKNTWLDEAHLTLLCQ